MSEVGATATAPRDHRPDLGGRDLCELLTTGMDTLAGQQLPSGEIPSFRRDAEGRWHYGLDILVSTLVHDALGCFDPYSPWGESSATEFLHPAARGRFLAQAAAIRRRIRGFVAWHEEAYGSWRASGRGSGLGPDAAATATAAVVLLEGGHRTLHQPWQSHLRALTRIRVRATDDRAPWYRARLPSSRPRADASGSRADAFDPVTNAHVARLLALVGQEVDPMLETLGQTIEGNGTVRAADPGEPMVLYHAVARIFRHDLFPGRRVMAKILVPRILARLGDEGMPGASLALSALLDIGFTGPELADAGRCLHHLARSATRWESSCGPWGQASPALTLALAVSSLARWRGTTGGPSS